MRVFKPWVQDAKIRGRARRRASVVRAKALAWNRLLVPLVAVAVTLAVLPAVTSDAAQPADGTSHDGWEDALWTARLGRTGSPLLPGVAMTAASPLLPTQALTAARVSRHPLPAAVQQDAHSLLHVLGVKHGDIVYGEDLVEGAKELGVELGPDMDQARVEWLLRVHRNGAAPAIRAAGVKPGSQIDRGDIARAAHAMGLKVGRHVDPQDVERLKQAARSRWAASEARRVRRSSAPARASAITGRSLARVDGVRLVVPSASPRLIGFHQASYGVARNMRPGDGTGMVTMSSRGRGTGRRSAADVSVPRNTPILSPVSGRVVEVRHYRLYGRYRDVRIRIVPNANHRRLVTVLHVTGPNVRVGSRVTAGRTVIARRATAFPFQSQIDRYAGRAPHVHVEVRTR